MEVKQLTLEELSQKVDSKTFIMEVGSQTVIRAIKEFDPKFTESLSKTIYSDIKRSAQELLELLKDY